jgi:hypothetical protein
MAQIHTMHVNGEPVQYRDSFAPDEGAKLPQDPAANVYAQVKPVGQYKGGRVWVESINIIRDVANVRYDAGEGIRGSLHFVPIVHIDFGYIGWDGWRTLA